MRHARALNHRGEEQRYRDTDHARTPLYEASQEAHAIAREEQRRENAAHEEDEGVQQGDGAEASSRLTQ